MRILVVKYKDILLQELVLEPSLIKDIPFVRLHHEQDICAKEGKSTYQMVEYGQLPRYAVCLVSRCQPLCQSCGGVI